MIMTAQALVLEACGSFTGHERALSGNGLSSVHVLGPPVLANV